MGETYSTAIKKEKAVLVAASFSAADASRINEYLDELEFLAETLGVETEKRFTQKMEHPDRATYLGKGKVEEITEYVRSFQIDLVIFDDDLTPSQLRNLERAFECKIYDRSLLILDIFLKRAQTAQAKTQVELARYQYLMPRLTRMWTHLERQRGGTSTRGGAGEKEIETDKRNIRNQISILKGRLEKINKQSETQRKSRSKIVRVALVGYTNVGKSTLMTLLSKSEVYAEDKLFATVDATVRKVVINQIPFLLSDTVGFIRKLPHHLIESFKSTLDEVTESDILMHVVDVSHPLYHDQMDVVNQTLSELGAADKPQIVVYNKIDQVKPDPEDEFEGNAHDYITSGQMLLSREKDAVFISAKEKLNMDELKNLIYQKVKEQHLKIYPNYLEPEFLK
ncbi:MAG: GTPase HflX [Cyclobacteriaceae bacterium]|nr:GTPase HflX [Cyclobacteriaceae bacterium]